MPDNKSDKIARLVSVLPQLSDGQLYWLDRTVRIFGFESSYTLHSENFINETVLRNFGDAMRVHHSFSVEAFSKDKFEYVLESVLNMSGRTAELAAKGNRGHDITIDGERFSLKTQADRNINNNLLWISKFMELGGGNWGEDPNDLVGLRGQFFSHLNNYERILSLRCLCKHPNWKYELVEIPIDLLRMAENGELEMKNNSRQFPKPGYCYVKNGKGETLFELYFDGGGERKLQIKKLSKNDCVLHATWEFLIPEDLDSAEHS